MRGDGVGVGNGVGVGDGVGGGVTGDAIFISDDEEHGNCDGTGSGGATSAIMSSCSPCSCSKPVIRLNILEFIVKNK